MGEGGFLTPPPSFLPALRKICNEHGIVLIIDEVLFQSLPSRLHPGCLSFDRPFFITVEPMKGKCGLLMPHPSFLL